MKEVLDALREVQRRQERHEQQAALDREESRLARKAQAERLEKVEKDTTEIKLMATRWKGAIAGILGGGALVGWFISQIDNIRAFFRG